jgi:hypothetical protein
MRPVVIQVIIRNTIVTPGRNVTARWARVRWRYTVVVKIANCVTNAAATTAAGKDRSISEPYYLPVGRE